MLLFSNHSHKVLGNGFRGTLEACASVTNLIKFMRRLVHEIFGVGNFIILNIIDLVSETLFPGIRLTNVVVRSDVVLN